ncbi:hypothetical protein [Xenophilus sp. Marseille-Q4582]|uniref:hypothetical protein n=1 Tax=Xenophilus sp. Marseille-Q4582 TaxID=2866600 RepID=UPI001CE45C14|nr:hypothetical protein [Xenophilus sp. Marseille-Q4582]
MDLAWWRVHGDEARSTFGGLLVSPQKVAGVQRDYGWLPAEKTNSGAMALVVAARMGARRIVMLGYDCQHTGGRTHWHGSHPAGLLDAASVNEWPAQFRAVLPRLAGVEVVNASRETALRVFPQQTLEEALS